MAYLLDADWIIRALAGRPSAAETLNRLAGLGIAVSLITVGEVYEGAFKSANPQAHLESFREFLHPFRILNLNDQIMEQFAETRALLRRQGNLIPDFDLLVGITAVHYGLTLLTYNVRHFDRIPDLKLYQPNPPA